jgi:predicted enzyme involved in methoxymalonyl-ACP biosynthesis
MEIDLDYSRLLKEARVMQPTPGMPTLRLALLGDCALQQFVPLLRALFYRANFWAEIHEGSFDGIEFEALNPESALYGFEPDVVVLLNAVQSLRDKYYLRTGDAGDFANGTLSRMTRAWDSIRQHSSAQIIQSNFAGVDNAMRAACNASIVANWATFVPCWLTRQTPFLSS